MNDNPSIGSVLAVVVVVLGIVVGAMLGIPKYNAWRKGVAGQGMLAYAEAEKRVLIEQAKAEKEAAQLQAGAIAIVGQAAQEYPEYREQQFMAAFGNAIEQGDVQMIFVPTEANVPILVSPERRTPDTD